MNRKAFQVFVLGLITLGTTSANAGDIKEWVQDNENKPAVFGVAVGGFTAAASLNLGSEFAKGELAFNKTILKLADMYENPTFKKAAEPFIQERDKINQILAPFVKAQSEDKLRLERVCKNKGCLSGVAFGLQRDIQNRQTVINKFELRRSELNDKIDDVHKYLASGGTAKTSLSSVECQKLDGFFADYQQALKTSKSLKKAAANYEKRAEKSMIGGVAGALMAVPVGVGTTVLVEKLSQRSISSETDKAQAELHVTTVHRAPDAASTNVEAK